MEQVVAADGGTPVDATVALVDGKPEVVPAKPGVTFEPAEVMAAFTAALTQPEGEREATVSAQVDEAAFSTADAKALEIEEQVCETSRRTSRSRTTASPTSAGPRSSSTARWCCRARRSA